MDILAIRSKTVSAVICQLQWREFRRKLKNECCDQFSVFVFWTKNWSINHALSGKSTKRGGPKCKKCPGGEGKLKGTTVGRKEGEASVRSWELAGVRWPLMCCPFCPNHVLVDLLTCCVPSKYLRADVSKYRPEVYKSDKSKILKKIHKVALGKLLT